MQQSAARELQLAQEDAETNIAIGTVTFTRSDIAKVAKSIEVGEKFHAFYTAEVREFCSMQNQNGLVARSTTNAIQWDYVLRARQQFKVDVERYVAIDEDRIAHEGPAIKAIQSFATVEKQWVLLNKPAAQTEYDFFYSSMCWFPRADFATITKLNLSNSGMLDSNAYSLSNTLTILPNLKYLDVSGNNITSYGEGYFVNSLASLKTQDIAIILRKITETGNEAIKAAINFTLKGLKYAIDQHAKKLDQVEAAAIAIYGDDHCKKGLAEAFQGISVGIIKQSAKYPAAVKTLEKSPWYAKAVSTVGIFIIAVKDNWEDIANVDMIHCIAGINDVLGFGQPSIEEYTKSLSGDNPD